ncbi:hypothetical protein PBY51_013512 [Eleginops maclovinus]|uniref:Uncharacterized protein n=1 Tax=Eleginops maclovinus TaxID=56733 RepID=A0AAN7Y5X9_ELEMC|nr:hypothetical protein PBY51_013512 [Eleginops maclovinus]
MEPVSLTVRFQSAVGFSAMSRGSAPSLIPLIGGWPPGSTAVGEFHPHFPPVLLFIHKRKSPIPSRTDCRGAPDSRRSSSSSSSSSSTVCVNSSAHGQTMR